MRAASIPARRAPDGPLRSRRLLALAGDGRLVEQVRRGNDVAFEVVFERHGPAILAFCRHMLGSPEEAEDAVQHTFAAAYRDLQMGAEREIALKPWLFTIARNRCLSLLRMRREVPAGDAAIEAATPARAGLAEDVERRIDLRRLLADVRELPDEQRAALLLTEVGDLSHADVAGVLDCEVSRVKGLVFRARSALIARREAREAPCERIREQLANLRGGALRRTELRLHLRECPGCRSYREQVREQRRMLAAALPVVPTLGLKSSVLAAIGLGGGSAGGLTTAAGGLGGATVAKVAVAGVLAAGGMVAGDAVVNPDRPAVAPSGPSQAAGRGDGRPAEHRAAVGGGADGIGRPDRAGRPPGAAGGVTGAERAGRGTKRGHDGGALERGRGPIDAPPTSTPVRRGPPAKQAKPWKSEPGAQAGPRGQANGRAKPAPGTKDGARSSPRANGHSKQAAKPNGSARAKSPGANGRPNPTGGQNGRAKPPLGTRPNGSPNPNGSPRLGLSTKPAGPRKPAGTGKPAGTRKPARSRNPAGSRNSAGSTKPPASPKAKADAHPPTGGEPPANANPRGQTP